MHKGNNRWGVVEVAGGGGVSHAQNFKDSKFPKIFKNIRSIFQSIFKIETFEKLLNQPHSSEFGVRVKEI